MVLAELSPDAGTTTAAPAIDIGFVAIWETVCAGRLGAETQDARIFYLRIGGTACVQNEKAEK